MTASTEATRIADSLLESRVFDSAADAAKTVPASGWRDWQSAGVEFSRFHKDHTPFALPFRPDSYVWSGPFTLRLPERHQQQGQQFRLGHFRRGVKKYSTLIARGQTLPPVVLLYHEDGSWRMQDGNHRYEALVKAGAKTYDAFLGKPKRPGNESPSLVRTVLGEAGRRVPVFYKAVPNADVPSILKNGLLPDPWIYLTDDEHTGWNYGNMFVVSGAYNAPVEVALLRIDPKHLSLRLLGPDDDDLQDVLRQEGDHRDWDDLDWHESLQKVSQCTYRGLIPPSAITVVGVEKFD